MPKCEICKIETPRPASLVIAQMGGARFQIFTCDRCATSLKSLVEDMIDGSVKLESTENKS